MASAPRLGRLPALHGGCSVGAALYLRVSTDKQTVDNQREPLAQLAAARGWEPVWYEETGPAVTAQPVFDKLMTDA